MISYLNHRLFRGILFNFWLFGPYHDIYCYCFQFKYMLGFSLKFIDIIYDPAQKCTPLPPHFPTFL